MSQREPSTGKSLPTGGLMFAVVMAVTVGLVLIDDTPGPAGKAAATVLLAGCWLLTRLVSRRGPVSGQRDGIAAGFVAALLVLYTGAAVIAPESSFAIFALGPVCFMILPPRRALAVVLLLCVSPALRFVWTGADRAALTDFGTNAVVTATLALLIGFWVCGVIRESAERADLIRQLQDSRAEVEQLSMERGVMAERERLARDIHDTLAQGFTSIGMLLEAAQSTEPPNPHVRRAAEIARENLAEARAMVAELTPASLADSLPAALRRLTRVRAGELGVPVDFVLSGAERGLPAALEVVLLRSAQEGLSNVGKHARASRVQLTLHYETDRVRLELRDDGCGFDPSVPCDGYGLRGMRSRVAAVDGSVEVGSTAGAGTVISIVLPTADDSPPEASRPAFDPVEA